MLQKRVAITQHEIDSAKSWLSENPGCGRTKLADFLGCGTRRAQLILLKVQKGDSSPALAASTMNPSGEHFTFDEKKNDAEVTSVSRNIQTLDELLAHAKIDLSVWEVERCVVNKWEVAMREPATTVGGRGDNAVVVEGDRGAKSTLWTRGSAVPMHEMMFQVKAWLKKKTGHILWLEPFLAALSDKAPALPPIRHPKPRPGAPRRSLEVSIVDPHIGLLCSRPESGGEWDLAISAGIVMEAIKRLLKLAEPFGPFEEIVMPFGNDFVHADTVFHTTTAGTPQPEMIPWHKVFEFAEHVAIDMVHEMRKVAKEVRIYQIPGNHSRQSDFVMGRILKAYFRTDPGIVVDATSSPYKFHRYGVNLLGFEHGHSIKGIRLVGLMANERPQDWAETKYREWHLGDQHRKGTSVPASFEEQGVSIEYLPSLVVPNEWHTLKGFNHQQRSAVAFVWDRDAGPIAKLQFNAFDR